MLSLSKTLLAFALLHSVLQGQICLLLQVASLVAQTVKCLSAMQGTQVQSLGWEDALEKEMAAYSSTFAWKILWTEEPGRLHSMGSQRVGHDRAISLHFTSRYLLTSYFCIPVPYNEKDSFFWCWF